MPILFSNIILSLSPNSRYLEATDSVGIPIYEEREFEAPNINDKTKADNDVKNEINDYSRDKLKPDEERTGTSPLDTTFKPLSVVSATRRVLELFEHLKIVTAQVDTSVRGRIVIGGQRVGGDEVKGLSSHSFTVQVVESFDGLPSAIQEDNRYQDENGEAKRYDVLGVWHNGTLYINAGDIQGNHSTQQTTFEMYEELILHEVVGHFGIQQIFGQDYKIKLQQLFNSLGGLEDICKIAKNNGVDMEQFESAYILPRTQVAKDGIYTESASRGKTSVDWFYGFKIHLICDHIGRLVSYCITKGNVDDRKVLPELIEHSKLKGKLFGDRGYVGKNWRSRLAELGVQLITRVKRNMKPEPLEPFDSAVLRKRGIIEAPFKLMKSQFDLEHTRHRSKTGLLVTIFSALTLYALVLVNGYNSGVQQILKPIKFKSA